MYSHVGFFSKLFSDARIRKLSRKTIHDPTYPTYSGQKCYKQTTSKAWLPKLRRPEPKEPPLKWVKRRYFHPLGRGDATPPARPGWFEPEILAHGPFSAITPAEDLECGHRYLPLMYSDLPFFGNRYEREPLPGERPCRICAWIEAVERHEKVCEQLRLEAIP